MEVDYSPLDERKEGGDGALAQVHDSGDGGSTASPMHVTGAARLPQQANQMAG